jgi:hypothetical protein
MSGSHICPSPHGCGVANCPADRNLAWASVAE